MNRADPLTSATGSATAYAYDLSGNIVTRTLGNGLKEQRTHDARNRTIKDFKFKKSSPDSN